MSGLLSRGLDSVTTVLIMFAASVIAVSVAVHGRGRGRWF
jgi:hypothetical protein